MQHPQVIAVERRTGDERLVLRAVEPVAGEGAANGGHVYPQLVGAAGGGRQTQQRPSVGGGENLIVGVGRLPAGGGAALQQRALRSAQRQVDVPLRVRGQAVAHGPVVPLKVRSVKLVLATAMTPVVPRSSRFTAWKLSLCR